MSAQNRVDIENLQNIDRPSGATGDEPPLLKQTPRMPQGVGGPNLEWRPPRTDRPSPRAPWEGDLAIKALRDRLSVDPDCVPLPPAPKQRKTITSLLSRLGLVGLVAAVVAYGITLITTPEPRPISLKRDTAIPAAPDHPAALVPSVRLVIEGRQAFANDPLPLGVSLNGGTGGEFALLSGLLSGTRLSVGSALGGTAWRVAARDLATAIAYAPRDFVGVMNASIDVRTPSDILLDRSVMRLEWIGKPAATPARPPRSEPEDTTAVPAAPKAAGLRPMNKMDKEEIVTLLKRGNDYLQSGDLVAARLVLRRAANAGNAQAALALGATFDPHVFRALGVLGFAPDAAQARAWYQRASELGSPEAARRIERLTQAGE